MNDAKVISYESFSTIESLIDEMLKQNSEVLASVPAIVNEYTTISHAELTKRVEKIIDILSKMNIPKNICICLRFTNKVNLYIFHLAVLKMGMPQVILNPFDKKETQLDEVKALEVELILQDMALQDILHENTFYFDQAYNMHTTKYFNLQENKNIPNNTSSIILGSGTTGERKKIYFSSEQLAIGHKNSIEAFHGSAKESFFCFTTVYYPHARFNFNLALLKGMTLYIPEERPGNIIKFCNDNKIEHIQLTADQALNLLVKKQNKLTNETIALPFIKSCVLSNSLVTESLRNNIMKKITPNLFVLYGANEFGFISEASPEDIQRHPGTVGKKFPNVDLKIFNKDQKECAVNEVGLIAVKSKSMVSEYGGNTDKTSSNFRNGWFYTGDLGYLTEDDNIIFEGRSDDMMIFTGVNLYPRELETVLESHPNVLEAAVFPLTLDGQEGIPFAAVVADSHISEQELLQYCDSILGWKKPQKIFFYNSLPKNNGGKVLKKDLIQMATESLMIQKKQSEQITPSHKYKQPANNTRITFKKDITLDIKALDEWLINVFDITIEKISFNLPTQQQNYISSLAWRFLLLRKALLQAINIPVFDTGKVISLTEKEDSSIVTLRTPVVANIPEAIYSKINNLASRLLTPIHNDIDENKIESLYEQIMKQLNVLKKQVGGGKSTIPILQVAYNKTIPFEHMGSGLYQLGWGKNQYIMSRSASWNDSSLGVALSENKVFASERIRALGLPAAQHGVANNFDEARKIAEQLGFPLVTKPINLNRGEGVSVDITDEELLLKGFNLANKNKKAVIVEKQVDGVCARVFIAKDKMYYAVNRLPKSVIGDGRHTIQELIDLENKKNEQLPPWKRSEYFPNDADALTAIKNAGFKLDDVVKEGALIPLRRIESTRDGGYDEDVTHTIHPDNIDIAIKAAKLFGLHIAGVDIISPDITQPWHANGAIVNEVNYAPVYGGGEIARATIPSFLNDMIEGDGRIPIIILVGDHHALEYAKQLQDKAISTNQNIYVTSHDETFDHHQIKIEMAPNSLYQRTKALLMYKEIGSLILVVQTDEWFSTGLPVDKINNLIIVNQNIQYDNNKANNFDHLIALLKTFLPKTGNPYK